jgi:hypothetical protein
MATSPVCPEGTAFPVSSITATSGPAGRPTVPGFWRPGGNGLIVIWWAASVML